MFDSILGGLSSLGSSIGSGLGSAYDSILGSFGGGGAQGAGNFINQSTLQGTQPNMSLFGDMANTSGNSSFDSILGTLGSPGFANLAKGVGSLYQINTARNAQKNAENIANKSMALQTDAYNRSVAEDEARQNLTF